MDNFQEKYKDDENRFVDKPHTTVDNVVSIVDNTITKKPVSIEEAAVTMSTVTGAATSTTVHETVTVPPPTVHETVTISAATTVEHAVTDGTVAVTVPMATVAAATITTTSTTSATPDTDDQIASEEDLSDVETTPKHSPNFSKVVSSSSDEEAREQPPPKKLKKISSPKGDLSDDVVPEATVTPIPPPIQNPNPKPNKSSKKKKSKGNNVWTKPTSRKGKKRTKSTTTTTAQQEDSALITPIHRYPDKNDDAPDMKICLSKVYKAEKVELSDDRLSAGSCKGYRMVRATRGVMEGAWYFEIKIINLGKTGHTRLGWSTEKGDLQAPVGYDGNSYGYRDIDGSKVHKALREKYGVEGYVEDDVIGFYINLPEGSLYAPKPPQLVLYKGQRYAYATDAKDDPPKVIPGSEICFYKNGICQGVAFKDLFGGRYYPAASMYTLPHENNCVVRFNFGPDFEAFPEDFGERPTPKPMIEVPYHGFDGRVQNGNPLGSTRMCPMLKVVKENDG